MTPTVRQISGISLFTFGFCESKADSKRAHFIYFDKYKRVTKGTLHKCK